MKTAKLINLIILAVIAVFFTSCTEKIRMPLVLDYNATNYDHFIQEALKKSQKQLQKLSKQQEVILVSDFVDLDNLQNHTKLGFLLSSILKDNLTSKYNLIIREVELNKNFTLGTQGLKLLTRKQKDVDSKIYNENYALVGTYTLTEKQLIIFIQIIDIYTGHVIASSSNRTRATDEIRKTNKSMYQPKRTIYEPMHL